MCCGRYHIQTSHPFEVREMSGSNDRRILDLNVIVCSNHVLELRIFVFISIHIDGLGQEIDLFFVHCKPTVRIQMNKVLYYTYLMIISTKISE